MTSFCKLFMERPRAWDLVGMCRENMNTGLSWLQTGVIHTGRPQRYSNNRPPSPLYDSVCIGQAIPPSVWTSFVDEPRGRTGWGRPHEGKNRFRQNATKEQSVSSCGVDVHNMIRVQANLKAVSTLLLPSFCRWIMYRCAALSYFICGIVTAVVTRTRTVAVKRVDLSS